MSATLPIKNRKKVELLLSHLRSNNPRNALLFQTGVNTSLRIGDLLTLQVKHVANPDGTIREYLDLQEQKTKKYNLIKITSTLSISLAHHIERYGLKPHHHLFFRQKHIGNDITKTIPITRDWASKVLCAAAEHCGITHFNTQSMRKTHAYHVYMATDKNIGLVQAMLKHSSPKITLRYIGVTQEEMDAGREIIAF